jgi:hypothetical protein
VPSLSKPAPLVLGCAAAAALVFIVAILDYRNAADELPPIPEPCPVYEGPPPESVTLTADPDECNGPRNAELEDRRARVTEVDDAYERRLVLYSAVIVLIGIAYLVLRLRTLPPDGRMAAFTDLGVGAVLYLVAVVALFVLQSSDSGNTFDPSIGVPLAAGGALLVVAALGSLMTWSDPSGEGVGGVASRLPVAVKAGAILTLAAIVLSTIAFSGRGDCEDPRPDWLDPAFLIAAGLAGAAVLSGAVALFQRRWFAALLLIGVAPFWVFVAALASACLS